MPPASVIPAACPIPGKAAPKLNAASPQLPYVLFYKQTLFANAPQVAQQSAQRSFSLIEKLCKENLQLRFAALPGRMRKPVHFFELVNRDSCVNLSGLRFLVSQERLDIPDIHTGF